MNISSSSAKIYRMPSKSSQKKDRQSLLSLKDEPNELVTKNIIAQKIKDRLRILLEYKTIQINEISDTNININDQKNELIKSFEEQRKIQEQYIIERYDKLGEFNVAIDWALEESKQQLIQDQQAFEESQQQFNRMQELFQYQQMINERKAQVRKQIEEKELMLQDKRNQLMQEKQLIKRLEQNIDNQNRDSALKQNELVALFQMQRQMNSDLQELKGNIRVYCRIRPLIQGEEGCVSLSGECTAILQIPKNYHKSDNYNKNYSFNFDTIFDGQSSQNQVYIELSQLIENILDGHNVCIFAYGQTGSGKTFTMQGRNDYENRGVIPRAVDQIFDQIKSFTEIGWQIIIKVGFQEIYNENIRDLISNQKTEDICMTEVFTQQMVSDLFSKAMDHRSVAETNCNEFSSRSHFIFQLNIQGTLPKEISSKNHTINTTLNLIDLAGSERLTQAKTEGDRLKETQCINKSLTALSDVINHLAQKSSFVPYRNSKLTHVLQKYLEGSSKTLMMVNISPKLEDFSQTIQSLRFAEKVRSCKVGNNQSNLAKKN